MARGIAARTLGPLLEDRGCTTDAKMAVPWVLEVQTVAGTTDYTLIEALLKDCRIVRVWAIMTGAGGADDTLKVTDGTNDITDTVDLSSLGDTDLFDVGELDDAYTDIAKGGSIAVTTASDALCRVYVMGVWKE